MSEAEYVLKSMKGSIECLLNRAEGKLLEAAINYDNAYALKEEIEKEYVISILKDRGVELGDIIVVRTDNGRKKAILTNINISKYGNDLIITYVTKKGKPYENNKFLPLSDLEYMESEEGEDLGIERYLKNEQD